MEPYAASICSGLRACLGRENKFVTEFFPASEFGAVVDQQIFEVLEEPFVWYGCQGHCSPFLHLEELYYLFMGIQYPLTPLLITETSPLSAESQLGD